MASQQSYEQDSVYAKAKGPLELEAPTQGRSAQRQQLAGLSFEDQLAAVKPPGERDAAQGPAEHEGGLRSERFRGIASLEAVLAGGALLRLGCPDHAAVVALQGALADQGFDPGALDGLWGPRTQQAIMAFQRAEGLGCDAILGPQTLGALDSAAASGVVVAKPPEKATPATEKVETPPGTEVPDKTAPPKEQPPGTARTFVPGEEIAAVFAALQDPQKSPEERAKLQIQLATMLGVPQLAQDATYRVREDPEYDPNEATLAYLVALSAWFDAALPTLNVDPREAVAAKARLVALIDFYDRLAHGGYQEPVHPQRVAIVSTALGEIGKVEAWTAGGEEDGRATRYGWQRLDAYFERSYGRRTEGPGGTGGYNLRHQEQVKFMTPELQSWCGHFAMWNLKSNGYPVGDWPPNLFATMNPKEAKSYSPKPGDVAFSQTTQQHYAIVIRTEGNVIHTIDGNMDGRIFTVSRSRDWWTHFGALRL